MSVHYYTKKDSRELKSRNGMSGQKFRVPGRGRVSRDDKDILRLLGETAASVLTELYGPPAYEYDYYGKIQHQCAGQHKVERKQACCDVGKLYPPVVYVALAKGGFSVTSWWAIGPGKPQHVTARYKPDLPICEVSMKEWLRTHFGKVIPKYAAERLSEELRNS